MSFCAQAANAQKLREASAEWLALHRVPEEAWAYFATQFAQDARKALPGDAEEMELAWVERAIPSHCFAFLSI